MWKPRAVPSALSLLLLLHSLLAMVSAQGINRTTWNTLTVTQGDYTRAGWFDTNIFEILTVNDLVTRATPPGLWLNIQPEAGFLRSIRTQINQRKTKLVFRFLERDEVDPSTNQTYGSLLKNLTSIKTFASGILVPKGYIWPVDPTSLYLRTHTSLVYDAHKVGLEVFASDFQNDIPISFNYSYDPVVEYLNFIDNENFSVDGVLSDFPLTPSEDIGMHLN
ncbi:Putative glycerophosphoryl diester phosphodiesterase 1 [Glycine soja]|nr:Putative glycerophosphoryl diester phosphodiesterase 1 [Glycine soja]